MGWILIFTPVFVYNDSWRKSFDDLLMSGYFLRAKKYKLQQTEKEKAEAASRTVAPSNREVGGRFDHMLHIFQGSYFTVSVTQKKPEHEFFWSFSTNSVWLRKHRKCLNLILTNFMYDNDTTCPHEISQIWGQLPAGLFRISWDFFYSDFNYLMSLYKLVPAYCEEVKVLKMHKGQNGVFFSSQHVFPF